MDALRDAAPLARLLLHASARGENGTLTVRQQACTAELRLRGGFLTAVCGVAVEPLGDSLRALRPGPETDAPLDLELEPSRTRVGARWVRAGRGTAGEVRLALRRQLTRALDQLLQRPAQSVSFRRALVSPAQARVAEVEVALELDAAVLAALLRRAWAAPAVDTMRVAGSGPLVLSEAGHRLRVRLVSALVRGELARALDALGAPEGERAALCGELARAGAELRCSFAADRAHEFRHARAVLRVLGAVVDGPQRGTSFSSLLRKHRQLSRAADPRALLDLEAREERVRAQKALRKLAYALHPDRYQLQDARLYAISQRVMAALTEAERQLRM